jgi:alpha-L-fucosidase 2
MGLSGWGMIHLPRLDNGVVSDVAIVSEKGRLCTVVNPWPDRKVVLVRDGKRAETMAGDRISFETGINEREELKPQ